MKTKRTRWQLALAFALGLLTLVGSATTNAIAANEDTQVAANSTSTDSDYKSNATSFNGHSYYIVDQTVTWDEAKTIAENAGGYLATVTSQEEQTFLESLNSSSKKVWLGGYRDDSYQWYWVTGETWDYTHWGSGEPNDSSSVISNETKLALWPAYWNDLNTASKEQSGFVIEWGDVTASTKVSMAETLTATVNEELSINATITSNSFVPDSTNLAWIVESTDCKSYKSMGDISISGGDGSYQVSRTITFDQLGKYTFKLQTDDGASASCEIKVVPSKVENLTLERTLKDGTMHAIDVKWEASEENEQLTGYEIWYSPTTDFTNCMVDQIDHNNDTEKILENLEKDQKYYVKIRGYATIDGETYEGEWSEDSITTDKVILVKEAWGFVNNGTTDKKKAKYYRAYTSDEAKVQTLLAKEKKDFAGGICYGMCQSAVSLLWDNDPALSEIGLDDLYSVKEYEDANYSTQEILKYGCISANFVDDERGKPVPNKLRKYLDDYIDGSQRPVILCVLHVATDYNSDGYVESDPSAHALLPIMYENTDDGMRVKVYDPNRPGDEDCWLIINEENKTYDYYDDYYDGYFSGSYILQQEDTEEDVFIYDFGLRIYSTELLSTKSNEILMYIENEIQNEIPNARNEVVQNFMKKNESSIEALPNSDASSDTDSDTETSAQGYWIDKLDSYTFTDIPAGTKITLAGSTHSLTFETDKECSAVLTLSDDDPCAATVTGDAGTTVSVDFVSYVDHVRYTNTLSGEIASNGTATFTDADSGIQISGVTSLKLEATQTAYDDDSNEETLSDKTLEVSDLDGTASYVISEQVIDDATENILAEDTDGDGVGDEVLADTLADTKKHADDGNLCWVYDTETGTLYLYGSGETKDYTAETVPWAEYSAQITSVKISAQITSLGDYLLSYLTALESVEIPESVTEIGDHTFSGDSSLSKVTIPTSVTEIGENVFEGCADNLVIVCDTDSAGEEYAEKNGYETELIPTHKHTWDAGSVTTAATCTTKGVRTYTCTACGGTKTESVPVDAENHSWNSGVVETAAACTTAGTRRYTCTRCGTSYTETIPATGHKYQNGVCSVCGYSNHTNQIRLYLENATAQKKSSWKTFVNRISSANNLTSMESLSDSDVASVLDTDTTAEGYWIDKRDSYTFTDIPAGTEITLFSASNMIIFEADKKCSAVLTLSDDAFCEVTVTGTPGTEVNVQFNTYADNSFVRGWGTKDTIPSDGTMKFEQDDSSAPNISSVKNSKKGVTIKWKAVSGAKKYRVYYNGGSVKNWTKAGETTGTNYTVKGLTSGQTYSFAVKCISPEESGFGDNGEIQYLTAGTIKSLTNTAEGVKIKWKKVTGAKGYYIYRKVKGGSLKKIKTIKKNSTTSYTDKKVKKKNGKTYTYVVVPYSDNYVIPGYSNTTAAYTAKKTVRLTGVSLSSVKNASGKKAKVTWKKNAKATGYQIQYSLKSNFASSKTKTVKKKSTVSATLSGLKKGKKYYVRVRAYKTVSGKKYYSAWSKKKSVKIKK